MAFTPDNQARTRRALATGPGKTMYAFSVMFRLAYYQQAGRVWSGGKGMENTLALAENVYVVFPTPIGNPPIRSKIVVLKVPPMK